MSLLEEFLLFAAVGVMVSLFIVSAAMIYYMIDIEEYDNERGRITKENPRSA